MAEMEKLGRMCAVLYFNGNRYCSDEITARLNIMPTTDTMSGFCMKQNYSSWVWSTTPKEYIRTSEPILELSEIFTSKLQNIRNLCEEMGLNAHIKVTVYPLGRDLPDPELSFDSQAILFANAISADIEIIMENQPNNVT